MQIQYHSPAYLISTFLFPFMGPAKIPSRNNFTSSAPLPPVSRFHYISFIHSLPANFDPFISGTLMFELPGLSSLSRKLSLIKSFSFLSSAFFWVPLCFHQSRAEEVARQLLYIILVKCPLLLNCRWKLDIIHRQVQCSHDFIRHIEN